MKVDVTFFQQSPHKKFIRNNSVGLRKKIIEVKIVKRLKSSVQYPSDKLKIKCIEKSKTL